MTERRMSLVVVCGLLLTGALAYAPGIWAQDQDKAAIEKVRQTWIQHFNAGEAAKVAELYAEDAVHSAPNQPPAKGRDAIRKMLEEAIAQGTVDVKPELTQVIGDWAFDAGTSVQRPKGEAREMRSSYLVILRRQAGDWHILRLVVSSDQPPPPAT